ncbi:MAG: metalloprotease, partial [Bacteroidales bacterium]|nr:metalloprotease [Bacteroidales bacterium]
MRKFLFLTIFACLFGFISQTSNAAPAKPGLIEFVQPDGSKLNIYLHGDEFLKWASSTDGYTLLFNSEGFYEYAILNQSGDLVPSGIR